VLEEKKRWTYEEYYRLDDDHCYEIVGGNLLMAPAPDTWHQDWVVGLLVLLQRSSGVDFAIKRDARSLRQEGPYSRFGVKEYWIGDPANKSLEILTLKDGRYEPQCAAEEKGKLRSQVIEGLAFDLSELRQNWD
jgi:Uma2 family endonuclease